jgi:hypothetical protein
MAVGLGFGASGPSASAITVQVQATHRPDVGTEPYSVSGAIFELGESTLVAPDGTSMNPGHEISGLSLDELVNRFAGVWTINDLDVLAGQAPQQHQFTVTAAALANFPGMPVVVSPAEGAVVPRVFEITWNDSNPTHSTFSLLGGPFTPRRIADDHYEITVDFAPGVNAKVMGFRAYNTRVMELNVTPLQPNSLKRFDPQINHRTSSLLRSFTAQNVPEPAAFTLSSFALAAVGRCVRRYRLCVAG